MQVHGIVWAGVRTEQFDETLAFFRDVLGVPLEEPHDGFAWSKLPNTSQFEVFRADDPEHGHFTTGPVVEFLVDDVHAAAEELRAKGVDVWGPSGTPDDGWVHFRAPDGNVYGLTAGPRYRRE